MQEQASEMIRQVLQHLQMLAKIEIAKSHGVDVRGNANFLAAEQLARALLQVERLEALKNGAIEDLQRALDALERG